MRLPTLIHDLYAYNDWANAKLLALSDGLSDQQLDAEQPMGMGSLHATLFHLVFAERLWLDRWLSKPWVALSQASTGVSLPQLAETFATVVMERNALLDSESSNYFSRMVEYKNSAGDPFHHRLRELLVHVVNHAIHHRAQAMNFLRHQGRTVPGGLDYAFYKLACPTIAGDPESNAVLRQRLDLEISAQLAPAPVFDVDIIRRYCEYGNWAMDCLLSSARTVSKIQLDQPMEMGPGSLRKTLQHICEAEQWWYLNWTDRPGPFAKLPSELPFEEFESLWHQTTARRDLWLSQKTAADLAGEVTANPGGVRVRYRLGESVLQLCGHGTHHRAQAINMLRRLNSTCPASDYVVWIRGVGAPIT